ncbi:MAG: hypothetical protein WDM80_05010 [Limisphaerales bacterium]
MAKYKLEYIWLDGYEPVANLRGKTQIKEFKTFPKLAELPMWGLTAVLPARPKAAPRIACSSPWLSILTPPAKTACSSCAKS